jgi:hypothetical protein
LVKENLRRKAMSQTHEYVIVAKPVKNDDAEVEKGPIARMEKNDGFMKKIRILKREETVPPGHLQSMSSLSSLEIRTIDKVEKIADIVYGINDGNATENNRNECLTYFGDVRKDLIRCPQAVAEMDKARVNYEAYCRDKDDCYRCGEHCLKHLGLVLLLALEFVEHPSRECKKSQMQLA